MPKRLIKNLSLLITIVLFSNSGLFAGLTSNKGHLKGRISINESWDKTIYMSHIASFEEMYSMSNNMIIAQSTIDSLGYFKFDLNFLPKGTNLFRIHISKKQDGSNSIIIGGRDENHLFFLANRESQIDFIAKSIQPPFKNAYFTGSQINKDFQRITNIVFKADSIASESTSAKRKFIIQKLNEELLIMADTTSNSLVSLYALYLSEFETGLNENIDFLNSYSNKWKNEQTQYFKSFRTKLPTEASNNHFLLYGLIITLSISVGYGLGKIKAKNSNSVKRLSVQEKRVFELLKKGASNQEISEEFNIGISTVKSHVSSILSKLKMKSRKEAIHID